MTHEYVVALGGVIVGAVDADGEPATAIAWAADRILAVGQDGPVRAISRGDSTFLDLAGWLVMAPDPGGTPEPGAPADLEFRPPGSLGRRAPGPPSAVLRQGVFTSGDPRRGPFGPAAA